MSRPYNRPIQSVQADQMVKLSDYATQEFANIVKYLEDTGSACIARDFCIKAEPGSWNCQFTVEVDVTLACEAMAAKNPE